MPKVAAKAAGSRKAWAALIGIIVVCIQDFVGLSPEQVSQVQQMAMAYIGGQGVVDLGLALKGKKDA